MPRRTKKAAVPAVRQKCRVKNFKKLQAPLSVVDDNRKVVGALSVVGATIDKIVSKFQCYFPDFLKKSEFP